MDVDNTTTNSEATRSPPNKRSIESDNDEVAVKTETTATIPTNSPQDERKAKKLKSQPFKTSIQLMNELPQIRPLIYDFEIKSDTPKPMFVCRLKFNISQDEPTSVCFEATANSKKQCKTLVSLKAIHYLSHVGFFAPILAEYHLKSIELEAQSLNLNLNDIINDVHESEKANVVSITSINHTTSPKLVAAKNDDLSSMADSTSTSYYLLKNDAKTCEIIGCQNPITILNYLLPNELKTAFTEIVDAVVVTTTTIANTDRDGSDSGGDESHSCLETDEQQQQHKMDLGDVMTAATATTKKTFKVMLRIRKDLQSARFARNVAKFEPRESIFVKENDEEFHFIGCGPSKKKARLEAALAALDYLFNVKLVSDELGLCQTEANANDLKSESSKFAEEINEMVTAKYGELFDTIIKSSIRKSIDINELNVNKFLNVYAAIIQTNNPSGDLDSKSAKIVSFSTGTKCINGEYMSMNGLALNDCHAEILSIRLLRKYFYKHLKELFNNINEPQPENVFEIDDKRKIRLKSNIKFHLYISSAPCGDGRIFSISDKKEATAHIDKHPQRKVRGLLRAKLEWGMGTIPVNNKDKLQTWDGIMLGERLRIMSCSDKLCKYNVVGVQGSLLYQFLAEPVYLTSVVIGAHYHHKHVERALFQRLTPLESSIEMPQGFKLNKPLTCSFKNHTLRETSKTSNKSLMWSNEITNEHNIEIINTRTGKQATNESHSDACKLELFKDWLECVERSMKIDTFKQDFESKFGDTVTQLTYHEIKQKAEKYQTSKVLTYKCFDDRGLGKWVTKPFEQNYFTI